MYAFGRQHCDRRNSLAGAVLSGSETRARSQKGSSGTCEILSFPTEQSRRRGGAEPNPSRPRWPTSGKRWSEQGRARVVSPSEGNEVRRKGWQEVRTTHRTCDVGELSREDPAEE